MGYVTLSEVRAEGIDPNTSARRIRQLIDDVSREIDHFCGWFFEPRELTVKVSGRGTRVVQVPYPLIELHGVQISGHPRSVELFAFDQGPFEISPMHTFLGLKAGRYPGGFDNVEVSSMFGFTVRDPDEPMGVPPPAIKRAALLMVRRHIEPLFSDEAHETQNRWRILSERTRDQSYTLGRLAEVSGGLTGEPEIDQLLRPYVRPRPLGAV